jgi:hypothetical protein
VLDVKRTPARHTGLAGRLAKWSLVAATSVSLALACAGASWGSSSYDAALDVNSMYNTTLYTGAQA